MGARPIDRRGDPPFHRHPHHQWWVRDTINGLQVAGPLAYDEYACENCNNYVIMMAVQLLGEEDLPEYNLCNHCGALALLGNNTFWSIGNLYWS